MLLKGKRIVVTGGSSGMGSACVEAFLREGGRVAVLDINPLPENPHSSVENLGYWGCDVSDEQSVAKVFESAATWLGGLDVLVHCAGIAPASPAEAISAAQWDRVHAVNSRGTMLVNQAAFHAMKGSGGRILNFASAAGVMGYQGKAHYAASKGAVLAWTRSIAREWAPYNITANAIAPAISTPMYAKTRSEMSEQQLREHDQMMAQQVPLGGKLGDPVTDFAPVMVFLAGDGAKFITGQTIPIDGGMMMLS